MSDDLAKMAEEEDTWEKTKKEQEAAGEGDAAPGGEPDPEMMSKLMAAMGGAGGGEGGGGMDMAALQQMMAGMGGGGMGGGMGGMGGMGGNPDQQTAQRNQAAAAEKNAGELDGDGWKWEQTSKYALPLKHPTRCSTAAALLPQHRCRCGLPLHRRRCR